MAKPCEECQFEIRPGEVCGEPFEHRTWFHCKGTAYPIAFCKFHQLKAEQSGLLPQDGQRVEFSTTPDEVHA